MSWITVATGVLLGLVVNEVFDLSPWMARRVAVLAARVWTRKRDLQAVYMEEWQAVIAERPGKLFKVLTAVGFLGIGLAVRAWTEIEDRAVLGWVSMYPSLRPGSAQRHATPPRSVPRERLPRRVYKLRQALWTGESTPTVVKTAGRVAAHTHCPRERGEALLIATVGLHNIGNDHELMEMLERAKASLRDAHSPRLAAHLEVMSALTAARRGQHGGGPVALSTAVSQLAAAESTYETAVVWHDLAAACSYLGLHEPAVNALERAGALGRDLGVPERHLANPGIHLRRALWFDHRGDTRSCGRLLRRLVAEGYGHMAVGSLARMRDNARASYGYAMARLAALARNPDGQARSLLLAVSQTSRVGQEIRTLGDACLAIADGRPDAALAALDLGTCNSLTGLGRGEPHRVRALALLTAGDLDGASVANQWSREAARAGSARSGPTVNG